MRKKFIIIILFVIVIAYTFTLRNREMFQDHDDAKKDEAFKINGATLVRDEDAEYDIASAQSKTTYFAEKNSIEAIRIHAYKVINDSSWSDDKLYKFDSKNFVQSTDSVPIKKLNSTNPNDFPKFKKFEKDGSPCVITHMADAWPASKLWTFDYLNEVYGNRKFVLAGGDTQIKFKYWYHYAKHPRHRLDDDPIYIFDDNFNTRPGTSNLMKDYSVPQWLKEDELSVLTTEKRPPFVWILIGIPRSGSSLHVDPLGTHAWNTLLKGRKRWVLFHPNAKFLDEDQEVSGHSWFNDILPKYKKIKHFDFIQNAGETIFLPGGWWHITLVVEDSICITQNYIGKSNHKAAKQKIMRERPKLFKSWMAARNEPIDESEVFIKENAYESSDSEDESESDESESVE